MRRIDRAFFALCVLSAPCFAADVLEGVRQSKNEILETKKAMPIKRAGAILNPTDGNVVQGIIDFKQMEGGVYISGDVTGLTPGKHGFHIHEFGDCSAPDGSSAGGHFNPSHSKHGGPDNAERHAGDLGNLVANEFGVAHYERLDTMIQLNGPDTIIGRSIIVHSNPDDYTTQPTGNAGGRISCGVIVEK